MLCYITEDLRFYRTPPVAASAYRLFLMPCYSIIQCIIFNTRCRYCQLWTYLQCFFVLVFLWLLHFAPLNITHLRWIISDIKQKGNIYLINSTIIASQNYDGIYILKVVIPFNTMNYLIKCQGERCVIILFIGKIR